MVVYGISSRLLLRLGHLQKIIKNVIEAVDNTDSIKAALLYEPRDQTLEIRYVHSRRLEHTAPANDGKCLNMITSLEFARAR